MKEKHIEDIFPVTMRVLFWMTILTDRESLRNCIGAKILKKVLDKAGIKYKFVYWGTKSGNIHITNLLVVHKVTSSHDMTIVWPWTKITLNLINNGTHSSRPLHYETT